MEAEHTSFFWPEVDDLLTYEFSADLMDQLHAGLQGGAPADAPPPPAPSFPPAVDGPPMPGPGALTMRAPSGSQPAPLSGPNPFLPGPAEQPTVPAADFGLPPAGAAAVPPVPDLKLSSPILGDSDPTIRTSEAAGVAPPPPADASRPDGPAPGAGYVPDVVAGSFGAEMAPPPPAGPPAGPPSEGTAGLDGLRGSRLFDPRPEPADAGSGRLKLGNLFEPTDPGAPPQTRRLVRLAGRQSPDEVDVTSARLVSPFDSSGPSVRSLFPSAPPGDRPGRSPFLDDGFGPAASEQRMGSPAPFGPDAGPFDHHPDGGAPRPPVSLSHSTVVDPASGPPVGASFLAPAPSDAWSSGNPAWTSVSDTVSDLPPRQGQGFLYLEGDADPWAGPQVMRQAESAGRDKGAMVDSVLDVLDRKRGALLAGALALTAVLGGLLAYSKLAGSDGTDASGSFTATSTSTASSVSSATGESSSGASVSIAGPTTILGSETTVAPSSAATDASSTSTTRKKATTSSGSTATTAAPTEPTTVTTQPPTSPTTAPSSTTSTTRATTSTTRATTTTTRPTTTTTASTTTTSRPTTTSSSTSTTTAPTDPPTSPPTSASSSTPEIATP